MTGRAPRAPRRRCSPRPRSPTPWRRSTARALPEVQPVEDEVLAFARIDLEAPARVLAAAIEVRRDPADHRRTAQLRRHEARAHVAVARPGQRLEARRGFEQLRALDVVRPAVALPRLEIEIAVGGVW